MKKFILLALLTSTLFLIALPQIKLVVAQEPITFKVEPESYQALKKGETFTVNITISNVNASDRLVGVEFRLGYNDTLLEVVNVTEGPFFKQFNQTPNPPYTYFIYYVEPETQFPNGTVIPPHVLVGILLMPNSTGGWPGPMPEGNGTIAQITFKAIYQPVEPLPPANCTLDLFQVRAVNDLKEELPVSEEDGYYEIIPALYPIVTFEYSPLMPVAGQEVIFNASKSYDPDGEILWYLWEFEDGTKINTTDPVITYKFLCSGENLVTLTVKDIDGLYVSVNKTIKVGAPTPLYIDIETGSLYFRGENCEFNVLITYLGVPTDVDRVSALLYFDGSIYENLTSYIERVADGYYRITYTIPEDAESGLYTLLVNAEYNGICGADIKSFLISETFSDMHDVINDLKDYLMNNITAEIGIIKGNLSDLTDRLNEVKNNLTEELNDAEASLGDLSRQLTDNATQAMNNKFDSIEEGQNSILTTFYLTSAVQLGLLVIVAAVSIYLARKK